LTERQVIALAKLAPTALFCQDPDTAGQEAVQRSINALTQVNRSRPGRAMEFKIVDLPPGRDPADVVQSEGTAAMQALLDRAVPLPRWQVQRALDGQSLGTTDGRDRALERAADAIRPLPPSVLRDELVQLVAGRLGLTESLVASALAAARRPSFEGSRPPRASNGARAVLDRREQSERAFLAYCLALPEEGEERLAAADLDELFSAPETRRAAEYLRGRLRSPAGELPAGDEPLARLVAELVIRAGQLEATPAKLELEALQLDLHNLDRRIATARTDGHERIHNLAAERQQVLDAIRHRLS
jgi:DNA primase